MSATYCSKCNKYYVNALGNHECNNNVQFRYFDSPSSDNDSDSGEYDNFNFDWVTQKEEDDVTMIKKNKEKKSICLSLSYKKLDVLPDLHEHEWISVLKLRGNNIKIIEKKYLPPKLDELSLFKNDIDEANIDMFVETITKLDLSNNNLLIFDGEHFVNLVKLDISSNEITNIKCFPPNIEDIDISNNKLEELPAIPKTTKCIDCSNNEINAISIDDSSILEEIDISNNLIDDLPEFPDTLKILRCSDNLIKYITLLNDGLECLIIDNNAIEGIYCDLPASLYELNLANNNLEEMPDLPVLIEKVDISDNRITKLKDIPESVTDLDCENNFIDNIPSELLSRTMYINYAGNPCDDRSDQDDRNNRFPGHGYTLGSGQYNNYNHLNNYGGQTYWNNDNWRNNHNGYNNDWWWQRHTSNSYNVISKSKVYKNNPNYVSIRNKKHVVV